MNDKLIEKIDEFMTRNAYSPEIPPEVFSMLSECRDRLRWVPMSERLPAPCQRVLYYLDVAGIHSGQYIGDDQSNVFGGRGGWLTDDVTHWMPLPQPPQQEQSE